MEQSDPRTKIDDSPGDGVATSSRPGPARATFALVLTLLGLTVSAIPYGGALLGFPMALSGTAVLQPWQWWREITSTRLIVLVVALNVLGVVLTGIVAIDTAIHL